MECFQEKPAPAEAKSNWASTGIYLFEPEVLDLVPSGVVFDIGSQLFPLLAEKGLPFYAQNRFFNWIDIGRVEDYWAVLQRVLRGEVAMAANYSLEADELAAGYVLSCQALPTSGDVVVDFDARGMA